MSEQSVQNEERDPGAEVFTAAGDISDTAPASAHLLPFAFAKRFGVVITHSNDVLEDADRVLVACKAQPNLTTLAELKRFARRPLLARLYRWWIWPAWPTLSRRPKTCWKRKMMRPSSV